MFTYFLNKNKCNLYSPVTGQIFNLESIKDRAFSSGLLGKGVGLNLEDEYVYAPCNGEITLIPKTKHAIGMLAPNGAEILIHVGLDTVNLGGNGFEVLVKLHAKVKTGQKLLRIDRKVLCDKDIDLTTPFVITNSDAFDVKIECEMGDVFAGRTMLMVCSKK